VFKNIIIVEGPWNVGEDMDDMWNEISTHIWNVAIEMFGSNQRK
jgi:hypothetical protein